MSEREQPRVEVRRDRCPYCHDEVPATPERTACNACGAWHHQTCWDEAARCSACGFERAPAAARGRVPEPTIPAGMRRCVRFGCDGPVALQVGPNALCRGHASTSLRWRSRALLVLAALALLGAATSATLGADLVPVAIVFGLAAPASAIVSWALARKASQAMDEG